jgi:hypothetical protein
MSWGGAPPWVYKEEIALAQSEANRQANKNLKYQNKLLDIKAEIDKYKSLESKNITKEQLTEFLDKISEILSK